MTVFQVLETIEALRFEEGFADRESVSAQMLYFPRRMMVWTLTTMMKMVSILFQKTFSEGNFFWLIS